MVKSFSSVLLLIPSAVYCQGPYGNDSTCTYTHRADSLRIIADQLFVNSEFLGASNYYLESYYWCKSDYALDKLTQCEDSLRADSPDCGAPEYDKIIKKADQCFEEKKYNEARDLYSRALMLRPSETYPKHMFDKSVRRIDR